MIKDTGRGCKMRPAGWATGLSYVLWQCKGAFSSVGTLLSGFWATSKWSSFSCINTFVTVDFLFSSISSIFETSFLSCLISNLKSTLHWKLKDKVCIFCHQKFDIGKLWCYFTFSGSKFLSNSSFGSDIRDSASCKIPVSDFLPSIDILHIGVEFMILQ